MGSAFTGFYNHMVSGPTAAEMQQTDTTSGFRITLARLDQCVGAPVETRLRQGSESHRQAVYAAYTLARKCIETSGVGSVDGLQHTELRSRPAIRTRMFAGWLFRVVFCGLNIVSPLICFDTAARLQTFGR